MEFKQEFVETKLKTKFSEFNIRVYKDSFMKETIVLWTPNIDITLPVLVRVHSECITGDMLGSLHCDCGKQLNKSLEIISEEGGVLIYLRQEGRGIGLFEKMKSYDLQSKGYDTFEANVLLGHAPDQRSYEMVKMILNDLNIERIRLITNNPSKVSEIAKSGIEVVERIPLVSRSNKYNKKYLETKKKKFQHFFTGTNQSYFYQFHVDSELELMAIIEYLKHKTKDPLLKICVGINADHFSLKNDQKIEKLNKIIQISIQNDLIPVLHFSCLKSTSIFDDINKIKNQLHLLKRIQLNDLLKLDFETLQYASKLFQLDIPLSDDNFNLIENSQFRNIIDKNRSFVLLDNSKGRGVKEEKESFMKKINALLAYGINNIVLCGGFGPDALDTYFELRRYYRINFSIDAETNLKTENNFDIEKIKLYLRQLISFSDPKQAGVEQTKNFLKAYNRATWDKIKINDIEFIIHPKVFHAGHFPSSAWFASQLKSLVKNESKFCEIGCGSGVVSCLLALDNPLLEVTATDINPYASENTKINSEQLGIVDRFKIFSGDVLDNIPNDCFDTIFWVLPFGYLDPGTKITLEEMQVFDPGYKAIRKFFQTAKKFLKPKGRLLIGFSSSLGHSVLLEEIADEFHIKLNTLAEKEMQETQRIKFELIEGIYIEN